MGPLTLLTLNTWGAPYAKHIRGRMHAIAEGVKQLNPDIICFQEVFLASSRHILLQKLAGTWRHVHYFPSGLLGSGLLTLSRYPIVKTVFLPYRMSGKPERQQDYYVKKGIGLTVIATPQGLISVFNTHTHAQYEPRDDNEYAVFTNSNLFEAVRFVQHFGAPHPTVLVGDMNTRPDQLGYQILTQCSTLIDVYAQKHPNDLGITFSSRNPYAHDFDQRLDYVFVDNSIQAHNVQIVMCDLLNLPHAKAYSDHYGLLLRFDLIPNVISPPLKPSELVLRTLHAELTREILLAKVQRTKHHEQFGLGLFVIFDALLVTGRWLRQRLPQIGGMLQTSTALLAVTFAIYHLLNAELNLRIRYHTLQALADEVASELHEA